MKTLISLLTLTLGCISFGQSLYFVELGHESALCRVFNYQSGNGVVFASAAGGIPDYTYQWENLGTGETSTNSVWGGLNPGLYEITVTDDAGDVISQVVELDSISPTASFDVISDDLDPIFWGYIGTAPASVDFVNTSTNFEHEFDPTTDTTFFFKPQGFEDWQIHHNMNLDSYTYIYGGVFTAALVATNKNDCRDTAFATIGLFGLVSTPAYEANGLFSVMSHTIDNSVTIKKPGFEQPFLIHFYSLSGKLIRTETISETETILTFDQPDGMYVYEILDLKSGEMLNSGKVNF